MSYRKGRRFEWAVRDFLESQGFLVVRAAASKPVDLVAIKPGEILLIECKYGRSRPTKSEESKLIELAKKTGATPVMVVKKKGQRGFDIKIIPTA